MGTGSGPSARHCQLLPRAAESGHPSRRTAQFLSCCVPGSLQGLPRTCHPQGVRSPSHHTFTCCAHNMSCSRSCLQTIKPGAAPSQKSPPGSPVATSLPATVRREVPLQAPCIPQLSVLSTERHGDPQEKQLSSPGHDHGCDQRRRQLKCQAAVRSAGLVPMGARWAALASV